MESQTVHWSERGPLHKPPHVAWHGWQTPDGLAMVLLGHSLTQRPSSVSRRCSESGSQDVHVLLAEFVHSMQSAGHACFEQVQSPPSHHVGVEYPSAQMQLPS